MPTAVPCCALHAGLPQNRASMLRLPRAAHYSICEKLSARELARLSKTASQWSREDDPRHAAFFACLAGRVARARGVAAFIDYKTQGGTMYLVPEKTISSMLNYLEAVERLGSTKIVEKTISKKRYGAPSRRVTVEGHEDIDGRVVARARWDTNPPGAGRAILVAGQHVTRIEPRQPSKPSDAPAERSPPPAEWVYDAVSYGTVVHKAFFQGRQYYYVAWGDSQDVEVEVLQAYRADDQDNEWSTFYCRGHRFVTKRPSWEPRPAWSLAQQTSIEMHARRLAQKKVDDDRPSRVYRRVCEREGPAAHRELRELEEYYREIDGG